MAAQVVVDGQVGVGYSLELLPLSDLFVDYHVQDLDGEDGVGAKMLAYQRRQERIANKIVRDGFNPDLFQPLVVNDRGVRSRPRYAVVDGGTRVRALQRLDVSDATRVPCLVHAWKGKREIRNYIALNKERAALTQVDYFVANLQAGDEDAAMVQATLFEETGYGIGQGWQCVAAIEEAYRRDNLAQTLVLIRKLGWLDKPRGKTQHTVAAISRVLDLGATPERALGQWKGTTPNGLIAEAKEYKHMAGQSRSVARIVAYRLAVRYNQSLRRGRLDADKLLIQERFDGDE